MDNKAAATAPQDSIAGATTAPANDTTGAGTTGAATTTGGNDEKRAGRALLWKGAQLGTSKVVYLLGTLVLGRLLTPNDFGLVAIATVAVTTVMTATETGMTNALVQASTRDREHYDVAWTIGLLRGSLVCAVLCLAAPFVSQIFGDARATPLVRMMAFLPLLNSINSPRLADLMRELKAGTRATILLITHDLGVVAEICDEVAVMYAGEVVEHASVDALFERPQHPYTVGLLGSVPRLSGRTEQLVTIEGMVPDMSAPPAGCRFAPRCPLADERCRRERPPIVRLEGNRWSRCHYAPIEQMLS